MYALSNVRKITAALTIAGLMGTLVAGIVPMIAAAAAPSVTLSSTSTVAPGSTNDNPITISASGLDASSTLSAAEVNVSGGTASNFSGSTFTITPGDGDPAHANQPRTVTVTLNSDAADDNASSNTLTFNYAPTAPVITMTGGPANGSTVSIPSGQTTAPVEFTFTSDDSSATYQCWVGDASTTPSPWSCGSPQDYALGASSSYLFEVIATNAIGSNTSTVDFSVVAATSSGSSSGDTDTNVPMIAISSGPADGSTVNQADATFAFTVDDSQATVQCSMVEASSSDSFTSCTSPQGFTSSADGSYRFVVQASNNAGTASTTVNFTVSSTTAPASSSSSSSSGSGSSGSGSTQTTSPSTNTGGGASGNGNNGDLGVPTGNTVIPFASGGSSGTQSGNAVIPTAPVTTTQTTAPGTGASLTSGASTQTTAPSVPTTPTVSKSSGGSALVASNIPTNTSSVTPGVPNTGTDTSMSSTSDQGSSSYALGAGSSSLAAAAATSGGGIPGWVWLILAAIVIIAVGIWALRQPA